MQRILVDALCSDCYSDLLLKEGANIEAVIESTIGLILLDFLGEGIVIEGVKVICIPATANQPMQHWLSIQATSSNAAISLPIVTLEVRLEETICCALLEYFYTVVVNTIEVSLLVQ